MNKLMGFYELKDSGLPAVPWKYFDTSVKLNESYLWTVRTAVDKGEDLNLPRIVGKPAKEALQGATELYNRYKDCGMVLYYPYFIANKSGTLQVSSDNFVIEAVKDDLWNLVTYNKKDVTIIKRNNNQPVYDGNRDFLDKDEDLELSNYAEKVRKIFRDYFYSGKTLLLEWSYAFNTDINKNAIGDKYLVFYEIREI